MTSLRSASTARRRRAVAAAGAVGAGLLVLSACDKPTPISTITVGTSSVSSEASCYADGDGDAKELKTAEVTECLKKDTAKDSDVKSIKVDPDENVRFGVDPKIADKGWTILLNGNPLTDSTTKTYRTIPGSVFFNAQYGAQGDSTLVSIKEGEKDVTGVWSFRLKKDS
jgi:hypothetical protein